MRTRIAYVQDDRHGWLRVPLDVFPDAMKYGTGHGYIGPGVVYLEEDCEAGLFMNVHADEVDLEVVPGSPRHLPVLPCSHRHVYCKHRP